MNHRTLTAAWLVLTLSAPVAWGQRADSPRRPLPETVNGEALGVTIDNPDGDNAAIINRYLGGLGGAAGSNRRRLELPAGRYDVEDAGDGRGIVWPQKDGGCLAGAGAFMDLVGENETADLSVTRIVGPGLKRVIEYQGAGGRIENLAIQGYQAATRAEMIAATASYAEVGLYLPDNMNVNHLHGDTLGLVACRTGIQCGETAEGEHADTLAYDKIIAAYCPTAIRLVNQQSVGHSIRNIVAYGCQTVLEAVHSCDVHFGRVDIWDDDAVAGPKVFLKVADNVVINSNVCRVDFLNVDGAANEWMIVDMSAVEGEASFAILEIDTLHLPNNYSARPGAILAGPASLVISGGSGLIEEFFVGQEFNDGSRTFYPLLIVRNHRMAEGANYRKLVKAGSTGRCYVLLDGVMPYQDGPPSGRILQRWEDGRLVETKPPDDALLSAVPGR